MNARLILDIFDYCGEPNKDGVLLFLDFEKAFDSVEWNFLIKTLHKFNFGNNFINWVRFLYRKPIFRLKKQWLDFENLPNVKRYHQGCPISAILYLFVAEILALSITQNVNIHGIKPHISELELKSVQHADDLTVILKDILSLNETLETIDKFCEHAGSKININKSECILLGSFKKYA